MKENRSESSDFIGLDLLPGRPHRGLLVRRVLELDQTQWNAVNEQNDIRPSFVLPFDDGELVDRQPVVVCWVLVVEDGDLGSAQGAASGPVFDRHAVHEHAVECAVSGFQRGAFRSGQLAERVAQGVHGQSWIQAGQGVAQALFQNDFAVV